MRTATSVIIPVYNKWSLTAACLRSLHAHPPDGQFEVIVIDNASGDETRDRLELFGRELFGHAFTAFRNTENKNFAGACNQGARAASHNLLFFLNNDTLLTPGWHAPLAAALDADPGLAAVGPVLLYEDGTVQHVGAAVYPDRSIHHFYTGIPATHGLARKRRQLNFITAAALLVRKPIFFTTGLFHEGYVNGLEDVELCYLLRQNGHRLSVIPEARIFHLEGSTRNECAEPPRNAPLLRQRCPDLRQPEFHRIARADGYTPYLGLFFETFLQPNPERLTAYAPLLTTPDRSSLEAVLEREQFWLQGYLALARLHEKEGRPEIALETLVRCSHLYPAMEVLRETARLATLVARRDTADAFENLVYMAQETLHDKNFFIVRLQAILETAATLQDADLLHLATAWRARHGKRALAI